MCWEWGRKEEGKGEGGRERKGRGGREGKEERWEDERGRKRDGREEEGERKRKLITCTHFFFIVVNRKNSLIEKPTPCVPAEGGEGEEEEQENKPEEPTESPSVPTSLPVNGEVEGGSQLPWPEPITPGTRAKVHWRRTIDKTIEHNRSEELEEEEEGGVELRNMRASQRPSNLNLERKSLFMREGDGHRVWKPKRKRPQLYDVVKDVMRQRTLSETSEEAEPEPEKPTPEEKKKKSLWERQRTLAHRLKVTQLVFKEQNEELVNEDAQPKQLSLRDASRRISENLKQQKSDGLHFTDIVSLYLEQQHSTEQQENGETSKPESAGPIPSPIKPRRPKATAETPGVVPLQKWRQICRQQNHLERAKTAFNLRNIPVFDEKEETSKKQHHPPADRTRSEPEKARNQLKEAAAGSDQGMAGVSRGRSPMLKTQSAIRRKHMQKQANVADWTDSGDVTLMDVRTREERFFDLVQDQHDEYNSLQQSGTLPQTQQNGKLSKTSINAERPTSVPVEIGSMTSSESLLAEGSTKTFEWPSSAKSSVAADKQTLSPERPSSAKSSAAADKQSLTPERPSSAKSSAANKQTLSPERPSSAKSSAAADKQSLTPERPSSAKSSAANKQTLSPERPSSAKSAAEQPSQVLGGVGLLAEDSKIHVSSSSNRVKLTPTHRRPLMPPKEAFTAPRQQRKSEVSLKSDTGSEGHRRRSMSPDLDVSTFV